MRVLFLVGAVLAADADTRRSVLGMGGGRIAGNGLRTANVVAAMTTILQWLAMVIFVPLIIAALPLIALWWALDILHIHVRLRSFCAPHGNNPFWKDYCEREILPALPESAIVLNWSERLKWPRRSFATRSTESPTTSSG